MKIQLFLVLSLLFILSMFSGCAKSTDNQNPNETCSVLGKEYTNADTIIAIAQVELDRVPDCIFKLENLRMLGLFNNNLPELPESIYRLKKLHMLVCSGNSLTELPESIGQLSELVTLDVSQNKLTSLPSSIGNLKNLGDLIIDGNDISEMPESIGNLKSLYQIRADFTSLSHFPESIKNLKDNLKYVWLSNTKFTKEEKDKLRTWLPNTEIY